MTEGWLETEKRGRKCLPVNKGDITSRFCLCSVRAFYTKIEMKPDFHMESTLTIDYFQKSQLFCVDFSRKT